MKTVLVAERRQLLNAPVPHSVYQVRTLSGETRTFKVEERRNITAPATVELEVRNGDTERPVIRGHAAVFDRRSFDLGGFTEVIARGAFRKALDEGRAADCRCLFNHDSNLVLASVHNNTLDLREDPQGLHYYADPADTSYGRDVRELIRRGDVYQSSFAFTIDRDRWEEDEDGEIVRTILEVRDLYDVSPVTYPAYGQTDVSGRTLPEEESTSLVPSEPAEGELVVRTDDTAPVDADLVADREAREARKLELLAGSTRRLTIAQSK